MVSWLPHVLIPGLFALAFLRGLPRKWVMALAPLAWVPDLDYVSNLLDGSGHRVLTHNVWIPLAFLGISYWTWRVRHDGTTYWQGATRPGWSLGYLLAAYYWASHVFLDVFAGGALLFWPVSNLNFFLFYEIHMDLQKGTVEPIAEAGTEVGPPEPSSDYTWMSFEHTAALAFLAIAAAAAAVYLLRRRLLARRAARSPDPSTKGK